jgi:putative transposase
VTLIWRMVRALCSGDGEERQWLAVVDYLVAENRVLQQHLSATGRRLRLNDGQRRDLAFLGRRLKPALRSYISIVKPETILAWYRRLVTARYDSSRAKSRRPGRPPTAEMIRSLIGRIARENPSWGYTRIRDQLRHLGHEIGRTTIVDILRKAGLTPDPEARRERTWAEFIDQHRAVIWATDFLTVDTLTGCLYILFFIQLETRRVVLGGITDHPNEAWMQQVARNLTDAFEGPLIGAKYLLHDRDSKYTASFDHIISSVGIKPTKLPARSPNLNAYAERWVLSVKSEALDRLILLNGRQVRRVLNEYLDHYHAERAHQGLNGQIIESPQPAISMSRGEVVRRKRLGGRLSFYYRSVA